MLVAFSGGMDSALLAFLLYKKEELEGIVHYIYEPVNNTGSLYNKEKIFISQAFQLAQQAARKYDVPFICGGNYKSTEKNEESMWREERYSFFKNVCYTGEIAVGHHFDDQLDSYLLHLLKNTKRCFIPYFSKFGDLKVIRPLLGNDQYSYFTKENIRKLSSQYKIDFVEDPANNEGDRSSSTKANFYLREIPNYNNRFIKAYKEYRIKEFLSPDSSPFNLETLTFYHV